jgi:hypothetical protein
MGTCSNVYNCTAETGTVIRVHIILGRLNATGFPGYPTHNKRIISKNKNYYGKQHLRNFTINVHRKKKSISNSIILHNSVNDCKSMQHAMK